MKIKICIGSSCHLKGSREVVMILQRLVTEQHLEKQVDLGGTFCMGNCQKGVCVTLDGEFFSLTPETAEEFFQEQIKARL